MKKKTLSDVKNAFRRFYGDVDTINSVSESLASDDFDKALGQIADGVRSSGITQGIVDSIGENFPLSKTEREAVEEMIVTGDYESLVDTIIRATLTDYQNDQLRLSELVQRNPKSVARMLCGSRLTYEGDSAVIVGVSAWREITGDDQAITAQPAGNVGVYRRNDRGGWSTGYIVAHTQSNRGIVCIDTIRTLNGRTKLIKSNTEIANEWGFLDNEGVNLQDSACTLGISLRKPGNAEISAGGSNYKVEQDPREDNSPVLARYNLQKI